MVMYKKETKKKCIKKSIGQILSIKNGDTEVKYLKKVIKSLVFHHVDDIMIISISQINDVINEVMLPKISRWWYTFSYEKG